MKYELSHDTLARQVYEKASAEAKARRSVRLLVRRALERYQTRGVLLTQDDLDEIKPYEKTIRFATEEAELVQKSRAALTRAAQRRRRMVRGVIATLAVFLLFALWQWQRAAENAQRQMRMRLGVEAKAALDAGHTSRAFRLAQAANPSSNDSATWRVVQEVLADLGRSGLTADLMHPAKLIGIDFSQDGQLILTADTSGWVKLWTRDGVLQQEVNTGTPLAEAGFSSWDRQWYTISTTDTLQLWRANGELRWEMALQPNSPLAAFHPDQSLLVAYLPPGQLVLLEQDGTAVQAYDLPGVQQLEFSASGDYILVTTDNSVQCYALKLLQLGRMFPKFVIEKPIQTARFVTSDLNQLQTIVATNDAMQIYDAQGQYDDYSYYRYLNDHFARLERQPALVFGPPDNQNPKVLYQISEQTARVWSAYRQDLKGRTKGDPDFQVTATAGLAAMGFSADGKQLLVAENDGWVKVYHIEADPRLNYRFRGRIKQLVFAPQSDLLLTTAGENTAQLWQFGQAQTAQPAQALIKTYDVHLRPLTEIEQQQFQLK